MLTIGRNNSFTPQSHGFSLLQGFFLYIFNLIFLYYGRRNYLDKKRKYFLNMIYKKIFEISNDDVVLTQVEQGQEEAPLHRTLLLLRTD